MSFRSLLLSSFLSSVFSVSCPANSFYNLDSCYLPVFEPDTFDNANSFCTGRGGNIASVHNAFENTYLVNLGENLGSFFWIGLYRVGNTNWTWSDGSNVTFTNWDPSAVPALALFSGAAIEQANGLWEGLEAGTIIPYICVLPPTTSKPKF